MIEITGYVIRGKGRGRELGFPTANLSIEHAVGVPYGVYAALARHDGQWYRAIANVGAHPTLPAGQPTVEAHILDHTFDLYGRQLCVRLGQFIRPEKRFESIDALMAQVHADMDYVRALPDGALDMTE